MKKGILSVMLLILLASSAGALGLGTVSSVDGEKIVETAAFSATVQAGIEEFIQDYPDLAAANREWIDSASLSASSMRVQDESYSTWCVQFVLEGSGKTASFSFLTNPGNLTPRDYAQAIRNMIYAISGFPLPESDTPVLVRRFEVSAFIADISYGSMLPATGIAVMGDGRLVIGHSMYATIVSPMLRVVDTIGKDLSKTGKYAGYNLRTSGAGTVLANLSGSGEVLLFNPPETQARTVVTGISSIESYAWLGDGTLVAKESMVGRGVVIEQKKRRPFVLKEWEARYETGSLTPGPDGSLISFSPMKRFISWYDKNGNLLKRIIPPLPQDKFDTVRSITWIPSGKLYISATNYLCMLDAEGALLWFLPLDPSLGTMIYESAWSESEQSAYLIFPGSKTICQYMDGSAYNALPKDGEQDSTDTPDYRLLSELDRKLVDDPDDIDTIRILADYYLMKGSPDYALSLYQSYVQRGGDNAVAQKTMAALKSDQLFAAAVAFDVRARATIREIGPESAKIDYSSAMGSYEQALALKPGDPKIIQARASLARVLKDAEAGINTPAPPLSIEETIVPPIFPSLFATYAANPVGTVVIRNSTGKTAQKVRATIFIPRFMDYPGEALEINSLADGDTITIPLFALFNREILNIEEDLPVQAKIRIEWIVDGETLFVEQNPALTIYRRTALVWDDSGKLASFVTPNEETVNALAMVFLDSLAGEPGQNVRASSINLSERIARAAAIISGLSALKIRYLEDPQTPLSQVMGEAVSVDTVRFPRTTIFYRSGDCDDTTALLASLLEAAGVPTAVLTSPGHVFLAFNTGIAASRAWMLERAGRTIEHQGELWIPIESTALDGGLSCAWAAAAILVEKWQNTPEFEFLPISDLRSKYPPLPLPQTIVPVDIPPSSKLTELFRAEDAALSGLLYEGTVPYYSKSENNTENEIQRLNRLGILHATYGRENDALNAFLSAIALDANYWPAMLNLANIYLNQGEIGAAEKYLSRALALKPDSPLAAVLGEKLRGAQNKSTAEPEE